jgi:hypothetical protein
VSGGICTVGRALSSFVNDGSSMILPGGPPLPGASFPSGISNLTYPSFVIEDAGDWFS